MANETVPTESDVAAFIAAMPNAEKQRDSAQLIAWMHEATGCPPVMWGSSIIGFGYQYRYASGREGDSCAIGFSPRSTRFSLYLTLDRDMDDAPASMLLAQLGKHEMGKGCLYVRRLSDVNPDVLRELIVRSLDTLAALPTTVSVSLCSGEF